MTCPHRWICDAPAGPTSRGVCSLCGEEQTFSNRIGGDQAEMLPWDPGAAYLPQLAPVAALVVTAEPEGKPAEEGGPCRHFWHAEDPDERGISHTYCPGCQAEY